MGAVNFSLDIKLVDALKAGLPINVLVETGTFHGDTLSNLNDEFEQLVSIELSEPLWSQANKRFARFDHIQTIHGDSAEQLGHLSDGFKNKSVLYWLDAHWCGAENAAGATSQCPLLAELTAIEELNESSVIVIDDARLFLATPPIPHEVQDWPKFDDIVRSLMRLSENHGLMVINDVIVCYPLSVEGSLVRYAREHGVDWLSVLKRSTRHDEIFSSFRKNELSLIDLKKKYDALLSSAREKDQWIRRMKAEREAPHIWIPLPRLLARPVVRFKEIIRPRLGKLNQYVARPLTVGKEVSPPVIDRYPLVSIVTPSFLQVDYIKHTMDSVLEQTYPNVEYYVQDGGSDDGTIETLQHYENRLSGWASERDTGQSQAINRGFSNTSGEVMAWLNSDDLLLPGAINTVVDYFNRHPDIDVIYGDRLMIDKNSMEIGRWILPGHDAAVMSWVDYIPQESLFWRRSIWEKAGGEIDESFSFAMDWDLLVRFRDAGANFAHIPRFLGGFRVHDQQKTSSAIKEQGMEEMNRIRARIHGYTPDGDEVRKKVVPFLMKHIIKDLGYRIKVRIPRWS